MRFGEEMRVFDSLPPMTRAAIANSLSGSGALVMTAAKYFHAGYPDAALARAVTIADTALFRDQKKDPR